MSLAEAIRAAVGGRKTGAKARIEDERPEDLEEEENRDAEGDEDETEAEGDDPDTDAEDGEPDNAADDDGDEKSPEARKAHARGRMAERTRMAAILGSAAAEANPGLAAHLAFSTSMKAAAALKTLSAASAGGQGKLAARMAAARQPRLGGGGDAPRDARAATVAGVKAAVQALHNRK